MEVATGLETVDERALSSQAGKQPHCQSCHFVSFLRVHPHWFQQRALSMKLMGPNNCHCERGQCCRCHSDKHLEGETACCKSLVQSLVMTAFGLLCLCSSTDEFGCIGIAYYVRTTRDSILITKRKNEQFNISRVLSAVRKWPTHGVSTGNLNIETGCMVLPPLSLPEVSRLNPYKLSCR